MNLKELAELGAFVSNDTVEVPVEWNGKKVTAHVRRLSYGDYESLGDVKEGFSRGATILSKALFLPDQGRLMTYEEAYQLNPNFAEVLVKAITEAKAIFTPKT